MTVQDNFLANRQLIAALGLEGQRVVSIEIKANATTVPTALVEMRLPESAATVLSKFELSLKPAPQSKPAFDLDAMVQQAQERLAAHIDYLVAAALDEMYLVTGFLMTEAEGRQAAARLIALAPVGRVVTPRFTEMTAIHDSESMWVRTEVGVELVDPVEARRLYP